MRLIHNKDCCGWFAIRRGASARHTGGADGAPPSREPARDALERAATRLFEVGGASATLRTRGLDRHGRNARVLVSHNPLIYRARLLGDRAVTDTPVGRLRRRAVRRAAEPVRPDRKSVV